jgi:hypothetical protein
MRSSFAIVFAVALSHTFAILGCTSEPEANRERRIFTEGQKAGCPAHPFKPEFQHIRKVGAGGTIDLDVKIYDDRGYLVKSMLYRISGPGTPSLQLLWDFKDDNGREVGSGYYFWAVTEMESQEERVQCTFYVHTADQDKMQ